MRLIARKASYYQERIRSEGFQFFPGAVELVREAAGAGLTLGVVTGALRAEVEGALRHAGIAAAVQDHRRRRGRERGQAPARRGTLRALDELNGLPPFPPRLFHPHEVLAVEDSPWGLEAATGAGLVTLGGRPQLRPRRAEVAHLVVPRARWACGSKRCSTALAEADARAVSVLAAAAAARSRVDTIHRPCGPAIPTSENAPPGQIEVIAGGMFSGKSEELLRRVRRAIIARQKVQVFKPAADVRHRPERVVTRDLREVSAISVRDSRELRAALAAGRAGGRHRRGAVLRRRPDRPRHRRSPTAACA